MASGSRSGLCLVDSSGLLGMWTIIGLLGVRAALEGVAVYVRLVRHLLVEAGVSTAILGTPVNTVMLHVFERAPLEVDMLFRKLSIAICE